MRQRTLAILVALGLACVFVAPASGAPPPESPLTTEAEQAISELGVGDMANFIVTLVQRANLDNISQLPREDRPGGVAIALQATAEASQRPLRALLDRLADESQVEAYEAFWIVNGVSVRATAEGIAEIARLPSVERIDLPAEIDELASYDPASVETNLGLVEAPAAWDQGLTGEGVVVAALDSGVYPHTDLVDSYRGGANSWFDPHGEHSAPYDASGHGTATMSVIVGRDFGGSAIGVAPGAQWIAAKIFDDSGDATEPAIHQAFQWVLDPDGDPETPDAPDVVNNSWSLSTAGCDTSFEQDLDALLAADIVPVFAAGNAGPGNSSSRSPANLAAAFSVGAVDDSDSIYYASSRGPSACVDDSQFPDLVAPGVGIKAADNSPSSYWYPTGTSMAAPHVAGAVALLLEQRPTLTAVQVESLLTGGAKDLGEIGPDEVFGPGRLDIAASLSLATPNLPPVAAFSVTRGKKGAWSFDASASYDPDGIVVSYIWDFGDGSTGSGVTSTHTYDSSGPFTATLTVLDSRGASSTSSAEVGGSGGGKGGGGNGGNGGSSGHGGNKPK